MTQPATCARCEHSEIGHKGGPCGCYTPMPEDHTAFLKCGCTGFVAKVALAVADPAVEIVAPLIHGSSLSDGGRSRVVVDVPGEAATAAAMMAVLVCRACGFAFREHGPKIEPTTRLPFCPPAFGAACVFAMPLTVTPDVVVTDEVTTPGELAGLHLTEKGARLMAKAFPIDTTGEEIVAPPALPPVPLSGFDGVQICLACPHEKHAHALDTGPVRRGACSVEGCVCKGFDDPPREARTWGIAGASEAARPEEVPPDLATLQAAAAAEGVTMNDAGKFVEAPAPKKARKSQKSNPRKKGEPPTLPLPAGVDLATFAKAFNALDVTPNADGTITVKGQTVSGAPIDRTIDAGPAAHAFESAGEPRGRLAVSEAPTFAAEGDYEAFLATKGARVPPCGLDVVPELSAKLFPFQRDLVAWALRRGRAALFADCGLGKGPMGLEWSRHVVAHTGKPLLFLAPLAVAAQLKREAEKFGVEATLAAEQADVKGPGIYLTNYEKLHRFDASVFGGVVCDESGILKSLDGKTRTALIERFGATPFKLCCTATPAPNDHTELGNHAEFLGVMTRSEMLSMYFVHDGGSTQDWRLKGHARDDFWRWLCEWAVMIRKPSDLGYPDDGFALPPLTIIKHVLPGSLEDAHKAGFLFPVEAKTLEERRAARGGSTATRVAKAAELVAAEPGEQWLLWVELNDEGDATEKAVPDAVHVAGSDTDGHKATSLLGFANGDVKRLVSKGKIAGWGMNFQSCARMAFVGIGDSFELVYQTIRRAWRFGQTREVVVHIITSEAEGGVVANIERKEREARDMAEGMAIHMRDIQRDNIRGATRHFTSYEPKMPMRLPAWLSGVACT